MIIPPKIHSVYFDGPTSDRDHEGDEFPSWVIYIGDEDGEPVSHLQRFRSFQIAQEAARHLATIKRLALIHEATTA